MESIKVRGSNVGRSASTRASCSRYGCTRYSLLGGGREVARLARELDAYRWICGGVSVNKHALNDFRSGNEALMDEVLASNVAALATSGAISLEGRGASRHAGASRRGAASFRRQVSLQQHLTEAG